MSKESKKKGAWQKIKGFFDERLALSAFRYQIPASANTLGYALGAITVFAFIILGITGITLAAFYVPTETAANASVALITSNPFLQYVRGVHYWTAMLVPAIIILHALRIVITGSYKRPRELNWIIGILMFLVALVIIYSGTVLKWDQEGLEALDHPVEIGQLFGLLPSTADAASFLGLVFLLHISVLPILLILLFGGHALLIRIHGISEPAYPLQKGTESKKTEEKPRTLIDHIKYASLYGLLLFVMVSALAIAVPRVAAPPPVEGIEVTVPPWMFLPLYPFENLMGIIALVIIPPILILLLLLIPFFDRSPNRDPRKGKQLIVVAFIFALIFAVAILDVLSAALPAAPHV